jgi:hypothetical protein
VLPSKTIGAAVTHFVEHTWSITRSALSLTAGQLCAVRCQLLDPVASGWGQTAPTACAALLWLLEIG